MIKIIHSPIAPTIIPERGDDLASFNRSESQTEDLLEKKIRRNPSAVGPSVDSEFAVILPAIDIITLSLLAQHHQ